MFKNSDYKPVFEIGLVEEDPAIKIVEECDMNPVLLAGMVTALFETVMMTVPEDMQVQYEAVFNKALKILMKERFNYDVTIKYPESDDE